MAGHLLVLLAVLVCLRLGWWQWDRTHDPDGTVQNLGYAVLWPAFGGTFIFMWLRFLHLETVRDEEEASDGPAGADVAEQLDDDPERSQNNTPGDIPAARPAPVSRSVVLSVATVDDESEDPELNAYNQALAALAEKDRRAR